MPKGWMIWQVTSSRRLGDEKKRAWCAARSGERDSDGLRTGTCSASILFVFPPPSFLLAFLFCCFFMHLNSHHTHSHSHNRHSQRWTRASCAVKLIFFQELEASEWSEFSYRQSEACGAGVKAMMREERETREKIRRRKNETGGDVTVRDKSLSFGSKMQRPLTNPFAGSEGERKDEQGRRKAMERKPVNLTKWNSAHQEITSKTAARCPYTRLYGTAGSFRTLKFQKWDAHLNERKAGKFHLLRWQCFSLVARVSLFLLQDSWEHCVVRWDNLVKPHS